MRGLYWRTILATAIAGSSLMLAAAGAQAHDDDRWRWERDHGRHEHWRHDPPRHIVYERERPVVVRQAPVYVAPAPVYMAPVAQAYPQAVEPSLNFNFNIPLR
jgi:hypothetical protein